MVVKEEILPFNKCYGTAEDILESRNMLKSMKIEYEKLEGLHDQLQRNFQALVELEANINDKYNKIMQNANFKRA